MREPIKIMLGSETGSFRSNKIDARAKRVPILYQDDFLVVFDKPSGLLVIPSPKKEKNTLVNIVNAQYAESHPPAGEAGHGRLHPCHRLDRDTSGAIIFARGKKNQQLMMREFHKKAVKKKYIAFVRGELKKQTGEIRSAIRSAYSSRGKGQSAVTQYNVNAVKKEFSVVEVFPETGRTNQIRIHFSEIGHPLLGERIYAFGKDFPVKFRRLALHAQELSWRHPVYKRKIRIVSPLPKDMEKFLNEQEVAIAKR